MSEPNPHHIFFVTLGAIAIVALVIGAILAKNEYSASGAFSVAAACVGVLGTLAAQRAGQHHDDGGG